MAKVVRGERSRSALDGALLLTLLAGCSGGADEREQGESGALCAWTVDALLSVAGAPIVPGRVDCGETNASSPEEVTGLEDCFADASVSAGAEYTVISCIDCYIAWTQVSTPDGSSYQVYRQDDAFSDGPAEVRVSRCSSFGAAVDGAPKGLGAPQCLGAEELYSCRGATDRPSDE